MGRDKPGVQKPSEEHEGTSGTGDPDPSEERDLSEDEGNEL